MVSAAKYTRDARTAGWIFPLFFAKPVSYCARIVREKGLHVIADFFGCEIDRLASTETDLSEIRAKISAQLVKTGMTELGNYYHFFGPQALTAVVCLAESHLTFHTWPEQQYASIDLFLCGHANEREQKASAMIEFFEKELFRPKEIKKISLER